MKKKYCFLLDMDETLMHKQDNYISEEIVKEVARLQKKGHIFVIVSGRATNNTISVKNANKFSYIASLLGCVIYKMPEQQLIHASSCLDVKEVKMLVKYLEENQIPWSYKESYFEKSYCKQPCVVNKPFLKQITKKEYLSDLKAGKIMQILAFKYLDEAEILKYNDLLFFKMPDEYFDISKKGNSKECAVEYFRNLFPNHTIVAVGDASNDLPMFNSADESIAMGNAKDEIKKQATHVTKSVDENGFVWALKNIYKL